MMKLKSRNTCYNCIKRFYLRPIGYDSGELFCDRLKDRPAEPHDMVGWNPSEKSAGYEKWKEWAQEHKVDFSNFCGEHEQERVAHAL